MKLMNQRIWMFFSYVQTHIHMNSEEGRVREGPKNEHGIVLSFLGLHHIIMGIR